jgi:hypothetical protein
MVGEKQVVGVELWKGNAAVEDVSVGVRLLRPLPRLIRICSRGHGGLTGAGAPEPEQVL